MTDERPSGASSQCPHSDLNLHVSNVGMGDTNLHYLELTASCKICGRDMTFPGVPMGTTPKHPACSPDGKELRIPMIAEGEQLTGDPVGFIISAPGVRHG